MQATSSDTVLVVDDEPQIRTFIQTVLLRHGFQQVLEANDGLSALSTLRALNGEVGVIVTDVCMPGLDGFTLSGQVRQQFPWISILIMSSDAYPDVHHVADVFVKKPFNPKALVQAIEDLSRHRKETVCD